MRRRHFISCIIAVFLISQAGLSSGQERNIRYYIGVSGNLNPFRRDINGSIGWGIEGGIRLLSFYGGLEYGTYFEILPSSSVIYPGRFPADRWISSEQFWGVHAGYVINDKFNQKFYLGIVVLRSSQLWNRWDTVSGWIPFTKSWLNIGPDFRYSGMDHGHIYLALAFTLRRGFKAGLGYMF